MDKRRAASVLWDHVWEAVDHNVTGPVGSTTGDLTLELVGAFCCSHAGLIVTRYELASEADRDPIYAAYAQVRSEIARLAPSAIVIVATDHGRVYPLEFVPAVAIGVGSSARSAGDSEIAPRDVPLHHDATGSILRTMIDEGIDIAFSEAPGIDHSFMIPLGLINPDDAIPIVPITINCNTPPRPGFGRCRTIGQALGNAIAAAGDGTAVLVGTGGLSHWVGSVERRAYQNQPPGDRIADRANHPLELPEEGPINEAFDREFLDDYCAGRMAAFGAKWSEARIENEAGNGAHELRNWMVVAGATHDAPADLLAYAPVGPWLTGTAVARHRLPG
jgi:hypothetical protein